MKKSFKSFVAAILAFVIAFGAASASFAAEKEPIITWDGSEFTYAGELKEGKNNVNVNNTDYVYYDFNAEADGYYVVSYPEIPEDNFVAISYNIENVDGIEYDAKSSIFGDVSSDLFYFEEGNINLGIIFALEYTEKTADVEIEYLGADVVDITFPIGTDYPIINNIDIHSTYYRNEYVISAKDFTLTFDSGKTRFFDSYDSIYVNAIGEVVSGDNTFEIDLFGKTFTKTLKVAEATDYVEKIELVDGELNVSIYYDGYWNENIDQTFKITYADGSTVTAQLYDEIDLKTGNPNTYTLVCRLSEYGDIEDDLNGAIRLAGHDYVTLPVKVNDVSFGKNFAYFIEEVKFEFRYINNIQYYIENLVNADSHANRLRGLAELVSFVNNEFLYAVRDVFEELTLFLGALAF